MSDGARPIRPIKARNIGRIEKGETFSMDDSTEKNYEKKRVYDGVFERQGLQADLRAKKKVAFGGFD